MEWSERSLSVLCADVTGGARLSQHLDGPEALYALGRCERRIRRSIEIHGGSLVAYNGGKVMAFFDSSAHALQSAIEMQQRVTDLPACSGLPLAVRVGVCSGHQSKEDRYFPRDGTNPAAVLATVAEPGHILLSIPKRVTVSPWLQLVSNSLPQVSLNCGNRRLGVFQVNWPEREPAVLRMALSRLAIGDDCLCVRYRGAEIVLTEQHPVLTIGRQADCDLALQNTRCSRAHGTIERRLDRFVFVDRSSNGTFLTLAHQAEVFVRHQEVLLSGHGQLSFGVPALASGAELLEFHVGGFPR